MDESRQIHTICFRFQNLTDLCLKKCSLSLDFVNSGLPLFLRKWVWPWTYALVWSGGVRMLLLSCVTLILLKFLSHANFCRVRQVTRGGRVQVVGRSLINRKVSQVSRRSVASVSWRSGRGCDSGARVYADRLTNGVRGSRTRKYVVVRSQVTLITWSIIHFWFTRMSVALQHRCKR